LLPIFTGATAALDGLTERGNALISGAPNLSPAQQALANLKAGIKQTKETTV